MDLRKDTLFFDTFGEFPTYGQEDKLYLDKSSGALYYWDGSAYALAGDGTGGVTAVTATAPIASSGGATPDISITQASGSVNGYLSSADWTTFNNKGNGTVTSVAAITLGTTGTDLSSSVATGTTTPVITLNVPTASATNRGVLSSADWTTFNGKQNAITLTTTGTSGAATLVGSTLNIPNYASGGLTYFTEAQNTAAPNNTVYVDSLTAAGSTTNVDVAIIPKGTGAILAAIPDNTTTGGNKRGANAIDLQTSRAFNTSVASGDSSVAIGVDNRAAGIGSVAIGRGARADGQDAVAIGPGAQATISNCFVLGNGSIASGGFGAVALGRGNTSSGDGTLTAGFSNTASGSRAVALGEANTASANGAVALGVGVGSSGAASFASGWLSNTFGIRARQSHGNNNTVSGDCQKSVFPLSKRTTDATATTLTIAGGVASTNNQVILSNNSVYRFKGTIVGKVSGTTGTSAWDIDGLIVRGANAASTTLLVGNVNVIYDGIVVDGPPTLAADTTNGGLRVQVVGALANIQWTAVIETTEVIYA